MAGRKPGRPTGDTGTRDAILEAARRQFADLGYQRTTLRSVALRAGVDPRLVLHYFGSKAGLFQESVELPVDPSALIDRIFSGPPEGIGMRAAEILVGVLEDAASRRGFLALLRAAVADPEAAASIRGVLSDRLLTPISQRIGGPTPEVRAAMLSTLLVGIAIGRYVIAFEPMAAMPREQLVRAVLPVIHHYLLGEWASETPA
ncbi:MAG TPA: TetR family transcriptional regulator [Candidatus Limnocylindrales bacterium]|nr:TetR family transcriptional regulator [Candidatus Limnocylindrales bacterium]